jgi:hypothetical protein
MSGPARKARTAEVGPLMTTDPLSDFVRLLIDIVGASSEDVFSEEFQERCLIFVLAKNRLLETYGTPSWPEDSVRSQVHAYLHELRSDYLC